MIDQEWISIPEHHAGDPSIVATYIRFVQAMLDKDRIVGIKHSFKEYGIGFFGFQPTVRPFNDRVSIIDSHLHRLLSGRLV